MKQYSNMRIFLEYISIFFLAYLVTSCFGAILSNCTYMEALRSPSHFAGIVLVYWWVPIPRMCDIENYRKN